MTDLNTLKDKIKELENRIKILEEQLANVSNNSDGQYMDSLYNMAKQLIIKNNKISVIFIQKKLLIDLQRAREIYKRLEESGDLKLIKNNDSHL